MTIVRKSLIGLSLFAAGAALATPSMAREQIQIVGSSTVYPFTTIVAERFGKGTSFRTPVIESTGTGGGFKLFCSGIGLQYPDATGASRRIKSTEFADCAKNNISVSELVVGNDGLAFASKKGTPAMDISIAHIAAALALHLPVGGDLVKNPLNTWAEVDAYVADQLGAAKLGLPEMKIRVLVPPPTSGTRDALGELFMKAGHKKLGTAKAVVKNGKKAVLALREDGAAIEVGENDNLIVEKLAVDDGLFGIFGFSFFDQNRDKVQSDDLDGVELTFENIADYSYPGARPLYMYLKREHVDVVPGLKEFFSDYISEKAMGLDGYLFEAGLVPLSEKDFDTQKSTLKNLTALQLN